MPISDLVNIAGMAIDLAAFSGLAWLAILDGRDLQTDRGYLARKGTIEERVDFVESPLIHRRIQRAAARARWWVLAASAAAIGYALQIVAAAL